MADTNDHRGARKPTEPGSAPALLISLGYRPKYGGEYFRFHRHVEQGDTF